MSRSLEDLTSYMRPLAEALLAKCYSSGLHVTVIDTLRTPAEQSVKLAQGVSWTSYSRHEPQPPEMLSEAIDIAPTLLLVTKGWSPDSPLWNQLGEYGKEVGLDWGGDWHDHRDPSHFQYRRPVVAAPVVTA